MTDKKIVGIGLNATRILLEKIAIRDLEIKQLKLQVQGMGKHIDELESQVRYLAQLEEEIEDKDELWARDVNDEDEGIKFKDIDKLVSKIIKKLGG